MQAVQRIKREKRMDGGKEKEEVDDPHTSAAKQKRPLRNGAELLLAERPSCSCVAACIRHYFPRQGRRLEPRWRASREFHPSEVLSKLRTGVVAPWRGDFCLMKWIVPGFCTIHFSFISAYKDWRCYSHWGDTGAAWQDSRAAPDLPAPA